MSETVTIQGSAISSGPSPVSDGSVFPAGATGIPIDLNPAQKTYNVSTGRQTPAINSTNAPQTLSGIGAGQTVTTAHTLYMRTTGVMTVVITYQTLGAESIPLSGLLLLEADPNRLITGVTVQGAGQLEFQAWGAQ
jgi:hypothetical protein